MLKSIGDDIDGNPYIAFGRSSSAHFMSWFIVDGADVGPYSCIRRLALVEFDSRGHRM
jgi:hypothetical protein